MLYRRALWQRTYPLLGKSRSMSAKETLPASRPKSLRSYMRGMRSGGRSDKRGRDDVMVPGENKMGFGYQSVGHEITSCDQ